MNQMMTKENVSTKNISTPLIIEKYLSDKELAFYKREERDMVIFLLPYQLAKRKRKIKINIILLTFQDSNLCRMNFQCKLKKNSNFREELLNMNSKLVNGNLSVASNSAYVSFNSNFILTEDSKVDKLYSNSLYQCFSVLFELQDKSIIEVDSE